MSCCSGCAQGKGCDGKHPANAQTRPLLAQNPASSSLDPMTGTGLDVQTHRALEGGYAAEVDALNQGATDQAAFTQGIAALGCDTEACVQTYQHYRFARMVFDATVAALLIALASGPIREEELALMGGAGTPAAGQYTDIRVIVDVVLNTNCGVRQSCVEQFGGMDAILTAILEFVSLNPIAGFAFTVPIWPPPPAPEPKRRRNPLDFIPLFESSDDPADSKPNLDLGSIFSEAFGDRRPVPQPTPDNSGGAESDSDVVDIEPEPEEESGHRADVLSDSDTVKLLGRFSMMGSGSRRQWGGRTLRRGLTITVKAWRAFEAGFARTQSRNNDAFQPERGSGVISRTSAARISSATDIARDTMGLRGRARRGNKVFTNFAMEAYFLGRVRFERFLAAARFAEDFGGLQVAPSEQELAIATGSPNDRDRYSASDPHSSTCNGMRQGEGLFPSNRWCSFIRSVEEDFYRAWREMLTFQRSHGNASELVFLTERHLRNASIGVIPPPPVGTIQVRSSASALTFSPIEALMPGTLLRLVGGDGPPRLPRAAQRAFDLGGVMALSPLQMDFAALSSAPRLRSSGVPLDDIDEGLAQEFAALKDNALLFGEMCIQGNVTACQQAASTAKAIAALTMRIAREADDPRAVLERAMALSGDSGALTEPSDDEERGLFYRLLGGLKTSFKIMTTPLFSLFNGSVGQEGPGFGERVQNIVNNATENLTRTAIVGLLLILVLVGAVLLLLHWLAPQARAVATEVLNFQAEAIREIPRIVESVVPARAAIKTLGG